MPRKKARKKRAIEAIKAVTGFINHTRFYVKALSEHSREIQTLLVDDFRLRWSGTGRIHEDYRQNLYIFIEADGFLNMVLIESDTDGDAGDEFPIHSIPYKRITIKDLKKAKKLLDKEDEEAAKKAEEAAKKAEDAAKKSEERRSKALSKILRIKRPDI